MHSETRLHFRADHPAFAGHFPGRPIVPGVLLLDAAVHALAEALGPEAARCQVSAAKFLSPVGPDETVTLSLDTTAAGAVRFEIASGTRKVATGTFALAPTP